MTEEDFILNEAEVQNRLGQLIKEYLPMLGTKIRMERNLTLRLGHREVIIDGLLPQREQIRGRYDLLVFSEDKPVLIAELKAPGTSLNDISNKQALSYARLHEPMVPLVLISNGSETSILSTYSGEPLAKSVSASKTLSQLLDSCTSLAAANIDEAISTLLGGSIETWRQIFENWNDTQFTSMTGELGDFRYPISSNFVIDREMANKIETSLGDEVDVIVLHGPPLSGITNTLVQVCKIRTLSPILYMDAWNQTDVVQDMANRLSRELNFGISKDDVRGWFNTASGLSKITLVCDGIPKRNFDELITNANSGCFQLVLGMDSEAYRSRSLVRGRSTSVLARSAKPFELLTLSLRELHSALAIMKNTFGIMFFNGIIYTREFRRPRTLRVLAAKYSKELFKKSLEISEKRKGIMLPPFPQKISIEECSETYVTDSELLYNFTRIARAYLYDAQENYTDPNWILCVWGAPSIDPDIVHERLDENSIEKLISQGILSWIKTKRFGSRLLIRIEELLASSIVGIWSKSISETTNEYSLKEKLNQMLSISSVIPTGEVILADAIIKASDKNATVLSIVVDLFIAQKPSFSTLKKGTCLELLGSESPIRVHIADEFVGEKLVGNITPWIVLSSILRNSLIINDEKETLNAQLFYELGSTKALLMRQNFHHVSAIPAFYYHNIPGFGKVLCRRTGIVEPLQISMINYLHRYPDEMIQLARQSRSEEKFWLAWRIITVCLEVRNSTNEKAVEAVEAAKTILKVLEKWWLSKIQESSDCHV